MANKAATKPAPFFLDAYRIHYKYTANNAAPKPDASKTASLSAPNKATSTPKTPATALEKVPLATKAPVNAPPTMTCAPFTHAFTAHQATVTQNFQYQAANGDMIFARNGRCFTIRDDDFSPTGKSWSLPTACLGVRNESEQIASGLRRAMQAKFGNRVQ